MWEFRICMAVLFLLGIVVLAALDVDQDIQCKKLWPGHNVLAVNTSSGKLCLIEKNGRFIIPKYNSKVTP